MDILIIVIFIAFCITVIALTSLGREDNKTARQALHYLAKLRVKTKSTSEE